MLIATCICLAVNLFRPQRTPALLHVLNQHLLGAFLLANLLTGAVNLTLPTVTARAPFALAVLSVYMLIVCAAVSAAGFAVGERTSVQAG